MNRLAIVASHVIQYQDPFFRLLAQAPDVDLTVLYCSRAGAETYRDEDMKTTLAWDIDLLQGYRYRFLRNLARDSDAGYLRLINPGIVPALIRGRYDAVIFMFGWGAVTALLGMAACWITRTPFFLYGDSSFPPPERTFRAKVRAWFLRRVFARATGFMTSGKLNGEYYRHYGGDERTFFLLPWAVDNDRFAAASAAGLRERYGIAPDKVVILFSAKLVPRKDPMTLLRAFEAMAHRGRAALVFMGDGELRGELETYVGEHRIEDVHFIGFINQREIPGHYAMSDVFVLPSVYEPRGAVINEAMACGLPVIVTNRCGSIGDIVQENDNAFVYPAGDPVALRDALDTLVGKDALRATMSRRSREIIADWDFARGVRGVQQMLAWVKTR
ncbi:MAG TPA: glycosyltransferase family 4 protein [Thermoanaerobaculia bacterium]|jgi:glycosyltransferase involved in cell wall biosynthesis